MCSGGFIAERNSSLPLLLRLFLPFGRRKIARRQLRGEGEGGEGHRSGLGNGYNGALAHRLVLM